LKEVKSLHIKCNTNLLIIF